MGNAFRAVPDNGAPHGRDVTVRDRKIEESVESHNNAFNVGLEVKSAEEPRRKNLLHRQFVKVYLEKSHLEMHEEKQA